jgi:sRNA-binding carbon storage regulator CsrA
LPLFDTQTRSIKHTGNNSKQGETIVAALDDDSETEITIIELEGNKTQMVIYADQSVSIVRKHLPENG